jgi:RNA-directed DNA polymerase
MAKITMRRAGNLFDQTCDFAHLLRSAKRARQGCGWTEETAQFFFHIEPELITLQQEMVEGSYRPGAYRFFEVKDPKRRTIAVAPFRDRVTHHALVAVMEPIFERCFIHDSYATRKGKGAHLAVEKAQSFCRKWPWYMRMDVEKFFDNVDHDILLTLVARKIKDRKFLDLLERIIRNASLSGIALPIGNLTSQFLANIYLDPLDHHIKERWCIPGYVRYMDDWVIFTEEKVDLLCVRPKIEEFLKERLRLRLKPTGTWINRSAHGLSFVGWRIFPHHVRQRPKTRKRTLKRLDERIMQWRAGTIDDASLASSLSSVIGHMRHFQPKARLDI